MNNADKSCLISAQEALPGRSIPIPIINSHLILGHSIINVPNNMELAVFGMGCFWGAERLFWQLPGIYSTAVGYSGGFTPNPSYQEVCTGKTGHTEVVRIVFDPNIISYQRLLTLFWNNHDPAQGMRQKGDIGTQYRSAIYTTTDQQMLSAIKSREAYTQAMHQAGDRREITTEIAPLKIFYYAEDEHQQYLAKHPNGYCSLGGTGICLPPHE